MNLAAAVLALTFATGSDEEVVQRLHVRFTGADVFGASCRGVIARNPEHGWATIHFQYRISGVHRDGTGRYTGHVTFVLDDVVITMPSSFAWARMTEADRDRAEELRRAIRHHEIGHVRIAEGVRDDLNTHDPIVAPDPFAFRAAADALGREGFERFKREEREYDALTGHGRKQHAAPPGLAGPDTVIQCP